MLRSPEPKLYPIIKCMYRYLEEGITALVGRVHVLVQHLELQMNGVRAIDSQAYTLCDRPLVYVCVWPPPNLVPVQGRSSFCRHPTDLSKSGGSKTTRGWVGVAMMRDHRRGPLDGCH